MKLSPKRQIQDNIIIAHEVFNALQKKSGVGGKSLAIKLDMSKAFNRLERQFLEQCLLAFGFS